MYRLGKFLGISLHREVLIWTLVGVCVTAWEVFVPGREHGKFLKSDKVAGATAVGHFPALFKNATELSAENIELLSKDDKTLFDFWTLRIYFLTYIILLYPACVGIGDPLAVPWIVVAGLRAFTPRLVCRTYMWILVFSYWVWMVGKALQSHREVSPSLIRIEPLQQDDLELRENRRRAKGIRSHVARLSPSEILGEPECIEKRSRDILDTVICGMVPAESDTVMPKIEYSETSNEIIEEEEGADDDNTKRDEEKQMLAKKRSATHAPPKVSDCPNRQMANLLFKLIEHNHSQVQDDIPRKSVSDMDIFDAASILTSHSEAGMECPKYPKPRYLQEYPEIFNKKPHGPLIAESSFQELGLLLFGPHSAAENVRNTAPGRQESTNLDEKTNTSIENNVEG